MSRVIKFRAWRKSWGMMVLPEWIRNYLSDKKGVYGLEFDNPCTDGHTEREIWDEQEDDLVFMQFTGLKDKNGRDIYEGDIVRCFDTSGEKVYDHEVDFFVFREEIWSEEVGGYTKVEIIGNVFESPELLTSTK